MNRKPRLCFSDSRDRLAWSLIDLFGWIISKIKSRPCTRLQYRNIVRLRGAHPTPLVERKCALCTFDYDEIEALVLGSPDPLHFCSHACWHEHCCRVCD